MPRDIPSDYRHIVLRFSIEGLRGPGGGNDGLDADAPRVVEIAGDRVTARSEAQTMSELTGIKFTLQFAGTTGTMSLLPTAVRGFSKTTDAAFPAWQGMQHFVSMSSGQAQLRHVGNDLYGVRGWTSVRDVLSAHVASQAPA